ncbi:hypothetical protein [Amycolatopsis pithecellobii]|uniref:hypothetical protein n=1 Tax=Amycolatopsis pithecellobii TaxID=664692 RepID=UPI0012B71249|nr:hypothetical protein [Amycolatopsis pithecellobii]
MIRTAIDLAREAAELTEFSSQRLLTEANGNLFKGREGHRLHELAPARRPGRNVPAAQR